MAHCNPAHIKWASQLILLQETFFPARHALLANARSELGVPWLSFLAARHVLLANARSELAR